MPNGKLFHPNVKPANHLFLGIITAYIIISVQIILFCVIWYVLSHSFVYVYRVNLLDVWYYIYTHGV